MAEIRIIIEEEQARGWRYRVEVSRAGGARSEHTVTLSWADHEHWSGGAAAPSRVVEAVVRYCVEREQERALPDRFDAATARRWWPGMDEGLVL